MSTFHKALTFYHNFCCVFGKSIFSTWDLWILYLWMKWSCWQTPYAIYLSSEMEIETVEERCVCVWGGLNMNNKFNYLQSLETVIDCLEVLIWSNTACWMESSESFLDIHSDGANLGNGRYSSDFYVVKDDSRKVSKSIKKVWKQKLDKYAQNLYILVLVRCKKRERKTGRKYTKLQSNENLKYILGCNLCHTWMTVK